MEDFPTDDTISSARIAELLAPTLGWEKSAEVTDAAAARLGFSAGARLSRSQTLAVLDELSRTPGMVGIAARFARSRLAGSPAQAPVGDPRAPVSEALPASGPQVSHRPPAPSDPLGENRSPLSGRVPASTPRGPSSGITVTADDIAALLTGAIGAEKALEVVLAAARRLGLNVHRFEKGQALAVLDDLAAEAGVVGLCARFGKARLILRFAA